MFVFVHRLVRQGASDPPEVVNEVIRIDLIQRLRPIKVDDADYPCTEIVLDGDETIVVAGELADLLSALDEVQ